MQGGRCTIGSITPTSIESSSSTLLCSSVSEAYGATLPPAVAARISEEQRLASAWFISFSRSRSASSV